MAPTSGYAVHTAVSVTALTCGLDVSSGSATTSVAGAGFGWRTATVVRWWVRPSGVTAGSHSVATGVTVASVSGLVNLRTVIGVSSPAVLDMSSGRGCPAGSVLGGWTVAYAIHYSV